MLNAIQLALNGAISIMQIPINFGPFSVDLFTIIIGLLLMSLCGWFISRLFL